MQTNSASGKLLNFHSDIQNQTQLGQMCGGEHLFRDRYAISRLLGRGGFGVTFLAKDMNLPDTPWCAIKQLCPKVSNREALKRARKCFDREAKILSQLGTHDRIPQLLDYFEEDGEFYLVQEYIQGMTLTKEVRRNGIFCEESVKDFLREILPLLKFIHQQGVIHRDIKPPNLIRRHRDGKLVLIDFGAVKERIALSAAMSERTITTTTTHFIGTMGFAPPEQLSLRPAYASDIYAVGITCLYLLTGLTPKRFNCDRDTGEISWRHLVEVSDYLAQIINKMLKTTLRERYTQADEIIRDLDLEPHLEMLAGCLTNKAISAQKIDDTQAEADPYLSPVARTARAIRDRLARLQGKKLHGQPANSQ